MKTVPIAESCLTKKSITELTSPEADKDLKAMEDSIDSVDSIDSEQSLLVRDAVPFRVLDAIDEAPAEEERSASLSHGSISVIGRRRSMEDAVTVAPGLGGSEPYDFFAVYDGHGGAGVAAACRDRLHRLVAAEMEDLAGARSFGDWERLMVKCFLKMDEEVNGEGVEVESGGGAVSVKTVGSTATVVVVGKEEIVAANCGDSRAILCSGGEAVPLTIDHKPDRPDEKARVEAAGGKVVNRNGYRILGVIAMSRSIGDHYLKPYMISEPEVTVRARTELDSFVIIATDGLWDVVTNEDACKVAMGCFDGQIERMFSGESNANPAAEAAAILAELAMARGSKDNISVVVVELSKSS